MLQRRLDDEWVNQNAPFPTRARPKSLPPQWTDQVPVLDPADTSNYGPGSPFGRQPPSPDILAQMQQWWDQTQAPPQQIAALPEVVQRSIREQPSYGEGEVMAPMQWWNPAEGSQLQMSGPQREDRLIFDRREALGIPNPDTEDPWAQAQPEGGVWSSRPSGVSPFASPLNQLMQQGRRLPWSLY